MKPKLKYHFLAGLLFTGIVSWASAQADHLLLTEVLIDSPNSSDATMPESNYSSAEYIEIYNPTNTPISLNNYFVSDLSNDLDREYYRLPVGTPDTNDNNLIKIQGISGADFIYQFPSGYTLQPGQVAVVTQSARRFLYHFFNGTPGSLEKTIDQINAENLSRYNSQSKSPLLFEVSNDQNTGGIAEGATPIAGVPKMISRTVNTDATRYWTLSFTNISATAGEHLVLFYWDGISDLVKDCDIVQWGTPNGAADRLKLKNGKKNNNSTYNNETGNVAAGGNLNVTTSVHPVIFRTSHYESNETATNGNGITGHDETTEVNSNSWSSGGTGGSTAWNAYSFISPGLYGPSSSVDGWNLY